MIGGRPFGNMIVSVPYARCAAETIESIRTSLVDLHLSSEVLGYVA